MGDARRVLRVAENEVLRYVRGFNRKAILYLLLAAIGGGFLLPLVEDRGLHPEAGLYRVDTDPRSPLAPIVGSDVRFIDVGYTGAFLRGEADLLVVSDQVAYNPRHPRSVSAAHDFSRAAERYYDRILQDEPDSAAAFPVAVNLVYEPRAILAGPQPTPSQAPPLTPGPLPTRSLLVEEAGVKELELIPNEIAPPFPTRSLLLAFAYLVPLNFINQFVAGSLLEERARQRGLLLLSAPLSGPQILLGKTLPYLTLTLLMAVVITVAIGATLTGLLAIFPVLFFSLATSVLFALVAKTHRELTFFIVTTNVLLSTYLFLPAIFTEVHPVSYLSPVTVVAATIRNDPVTWTQFAYATAPLGLAALVVAALALAVYREEDLFAPRSVLSKLVSGIRVLTPRPLHLVPAAALLVPFALGLEVFVLIFAVTLNLKIALVLFLLGAAFVEEALKGLLAYAACAPPARRYAPAASGLLIGLGFFLGEKLVLLFSLIGLGLLPNGTAVLAIYGIAPSLLILALPLLLHSAVATALAYAARLGLRVFYAVYPLAALAHAAYNGLVFLYFRQVIAIGP